MSPARVMAADLAAHVGRHVTIAGWLHRKRELKSVTFLIIRDRTGLAQVVLAGSDSAVLARGGDPPEPPAAVLARGGDPPEPPAAVLARGGTLLAGGQPRTPDGPEPPAVGQRAPVGFPEESVLAVTGLVTASEQAPGGAEITQPTLTELGDAIEPPPFDLYRPVVTAALPTVLDHAPASLRHPVLRAGLEISAASVAGFRAALGARGFTEIHTPKIVESATESGASVFGIDYFGRPAYLAQSPQFYKQAMVGVFERVFEVGPVFRAEPHDTARHLAQYTSLDAELGFIEDHHDVMAVLRDVVAQMAAAVAERAGPAAELLGIKLPEVPERIPELHFTDAQELIAARAGWDPRGEPDLSPADERWLCEWALREHGSELVYVTGFPAVAKPFYTHPDPARPGYTNGFDLLFRGLELVTGGQRLHRYGDYLVALAASGHDPVPYASYLQVFRHGMPPHGGFAIGLERWTARLTGAANIRQVTAFPRDVHRLSP